MPKETSSRRGEQLPIPHTFADEETRMRYEISQKAKQIAATLGPEEPPYNSQAIRFRRNDEEFGLEVVFSVGTSWPTGQKALLVPDRTLEVLRQMNIPYKIITLK